MRLQDLSKKMRVSVATASRALNPDTAHLVAEPLRSKIQAYAQKMHYSPNQAARHLVSGRTHTIGVILYSAFKTLFFSEYLSSTQWGIAAGLETDPHFGCKVVILPRGKSLTEMDQHVIGSGVDGILISGLRDLKTQELEDMLRLAERKWPQPIVALNLEPAKRSRISTVSFSNVNAAYGAITHLIQNGRKRIGLIYNGDNAPDVQDRIQGFKKALEDHQLPWTPAATTTGNASPESGYQATLELFKNKENADLTAIFCTNDEMAFGAMRALRALGKRCPEDVAVMGFDGLMVGEYTTPRLSSVSQPFFEIAKTGTQLLLDLIEERRKGPAHLTVESRLIIRESA
jgi:LacI family transcriptional regulator